MVGQALYGAIRQSRYYRDGGRFTGVFVDDVKYFVHRTAYGFRLRPSAELFSNGIQARHPRFDIGGYHGIADGVECNCKLFLADLQGDVGLLQLLIGRLLNLQQMLCFEMNQITDLLLCVVID